ncbi:Vitamin B12 ABC transporter, ATPase component BtuD [Pseudoalteromonas luteoviolacea B = ATCC 29581]|nr:Vitamin B12 ABC transporter, ATPase component BtuD [Pseudoalteromonas luteoviolacea B = ATCC 29581]
MTQAASRKDDVLFSVSNLSVQKGELCLLEDVSFMIRRGSFVGLIGPNGAGKSTLLRCLYRYLSPSHGEICYAGVSLSALSLKHFSQSVAVVLQEVANDFNLVVEDVVLMGRTPHKPLFSALSSHDKQLAHDALVAVGLIDKVHQTYMQLSGGEKQRVMIAKAMVQQPELLIMDEPTSHLDVKYQIQIMELAKAMQVTVLASFHDLNLAGAICDELLVLKKGKLVASGKPLEVITETTLSEVFAVCAHVEAVACQFANAAHKIPHIRYFYGYR